jgi:hypothetical protein
VDATTSCGACCGLYNVVRNNRQDLERLLAERTTRFADVPREIGPLDAFAQWSARQAGPPPLAHFHHCPFVGFMGEGPRRVGCLLHPLAAGNQGVDLRGLSYYGSFTCRTYFCQASRELPGRHQLLLKTIFDHWYPYGLVVTELRLVGLLLEAVEARGGQPIAPRLVAGNPEARCALNRLLSLKVDWPWRQAQHRARAKIHYLFKDGAHQRPAFTSTVPGGRYTAVFQELVARFSGPHEERRACRLLDSAIGRAAGAITAAYSPSIEERTVHARP